MKKPSTPPTLYACEIICTTCQNKFYLKSTKQITKIDICSHCHPFYVGKNQYVHEASRVDKFNKRYQKTTPTVSPKQ